MCDTFDTDLLVHDIYSKEEEQRSHKSINQKKIKYKVKKNRSL
jgi:hypothetical protein